MSAFIAVQLLTKIFTILLTTVQRMAMLPAPNDQQHIDYKTTTSKGKMHNGERSAGTQIHTTWTFRTASMSMVLGNSTVKGAIRG